MWQILSMPHLHASWVQVTFPGFVLYNHSQTLIIISYHPSYVQHPPHTSALACCLSFCGDWHKSDPRFIIYPWLWCFSLFQQRQARYEENLSCLLRSPSVFVSTQYINLTYIYIPISKREGGCSSHLQLRKLFKSANSKSLMDNVSSNK